MCCGWTMGHQSTRCIWEDKNPDYDLQEHHSKRHTGWCNHQTVGVFLCQRYRMTTRHWVKDTETNTTMSWRDLTNLWTLIQKFSFMYPSHNVENWDSNICKEKQPNIPDEACAKPDSYACQQQLLHQVLTACIPSRSNTFPHQNADFIH